MADSFAGTGALVRLALRRDRLLLMLWILGFAGMAGFSAAATVGLYPDEGSRVQAAEIVNATGALVALYGPVYDPTSVGALSLFKLTAFGAAITAVLFVFVVIRHTRAEEEAGRLELLGAGRLGRLAALSAALIVAFGASLVLGVASAGSLIAAGLPVAGSFAFGLGWAFTGIAFASLAGVTAQVTTGARAGRSLALIAVAVAYALRAVGDVASGGGNWLSWLSPIGWMQQVRAYAGDRWWVLLLPTAMAAVCVPVAMVLRSRRDLGAGLLTDRAGPSQGKLSSVSGLAWRLQRTVLISWAVGFAAFGFLLGSISDSVTGFLDSPQAAEYLQKLGGTDALADAFLAAELAIMGVLVAAYGIEAASRLHGEEEDGHAEVLLATSVSRGRWAASHLVIALLGVAGVLFVGGLAVGLGAWVATGDAGQVGALAVAALSKVPAAWVLTGLLFLLFGWLPRAVPVIWGVFAVAVVVGEFGPLWDAPQWVMNLSPFVHSPGLPAPNASLVGLVPLTLTAVVLLGLGFVGWRRRDLTTP